MSAANHQPKRTALLTGATGAIGAAIATQLAQQPDLALILVVRDRARGARLCDQISRQTGNRNVRFELADLSLRASIRALAKRLDQPLHVLINNAAEAPRQRLETAEGLERQFATNVMGYFWMIREFEPRLMQSAPARIVNVASYWAGDLDLLDLQFTRRRYDNDTAYRQSKQADRLLTVWFAHRLSASGVTVNACHPGDVNSKLSNDLGFFGHQSPDEGARTPFFLATDPGLEGVTGKYFADCTEVACEFGSNGQAVEALATACLEIDRELGD